MFLNFWNKFELIRSRFSNEYSTEKVVCLFHGFQDSPVSLYDETVKIDQICRFSGDNFFGIFFDQIKKKEDIFYFFDFNKEIIEIK